jgi:hypothetical protein
MKRITTALLSSVLMMMSCTSNETLDKKLIGKWTMEKVYEYDADVTAKHNPMNNRYVVFHADGTFLSDGDPFGKNTGRWSVDNSTSVLFLDSDVDDDDSEWKVSFEGDEITWTGIGHPRKENTKLIHKRSKE